MCACVTAVLSPGTMERKEGHLQETGQAGVGQGGCLGPDGWVGTSCDREENENKEGLRHLL